MAQLTVPDTRYTNDEKAAVNHPSSGTCYGYVRIYDRDPGEQEQYSALCNAGVTEDCIYIDAQPHSRAVPSEYASLVQQLEAGDTVFISSLDRLGTTYEDIIAQWQLLTQVKRATVVVLDIPLLDMRTKRREQQDLFLAELALQFLAYASTREREGIRQRQHEGILAAKERGVRFGRPPKPIPPQFDMLLTQWRNKEISSRQAAKQLGVAQETFLRWSRKRTG